MALSNNPNKTRRIEAAWNREITQRWSKFKSAVGNIPLTALTTNADDEEQSNIDAFIAAFALLASDELLGGNGGAWQNEYQTLSYERSAERAIESARPILTAEQALFLTAVIGGQLSYLAENRNELKFLHTRANDSLNKWVTSLISEVTNIVQSGLGNLPDKQLIDDIKKRIGVSESRARVIATTEVSQASQKGVINQCKIMNDTLEGDFGLRWITVRDSRVRHLHAGWHGQIMTVKQASVNVGISPWNCRCALVIVRIGQQSEKVKLRFDTERATLLRLEISTR